MADAESQMSEIEKRKMEHIQVCLEKPVNFEKKNGFEKYGFGCNPLQDTDPEDIDTSTVFRGKRFRAPLLIEAITGGFSGAEKINKNLAYAAEQMGIGMGVGSQRAMVENPELTRTFFVRDIAPSIFLLGNIGCFQIKNYILEVIKRMVEDIGADGLAIHLNPIQEFIQKEGEAGKNKISLGQEIFERIEEICSRLGYPVVAKEVGFGISGDVAKKLEKAGVSAIDVAGAGGTNWAKVEYYRGGEGAERFFDYGIPTAESLVECRKAVKIPLIASGGMRRGEECAKAIAMGASLAGMAAPFLKPAMEGPESVIKYLEKIISELKHTMHKAGARNVEELKRIKTIKL